MKSSLAAQNTENTKFIKDLHSFYFGLKLGQCTPFFPSHCVLCHPQFSNVKDISSSYAYINNKMVKSSLSHHPNDCL